MNSIHKWIFVIPILKAGEDPIDSDLHRFHLFVDRSPLKSDATADVRGLFSPLRYDLSDTCSKFDT